MSEERTVTATGQRTDTQMIADDARIMLQKIAGRLSRLEGEGDHAGVCWLRKQILSVERRAQERDAAMTPSASGAERNHRGASEHWYRGTTPADRQAAVKGRDAW